MSAEPVVEIKTYFIQSQVDGRIKIGKSEMPERRLRDLQVAHGASLNLLLIMAGDKEKELHLKFKKHRASGEWFFPVKELMGYIISQHCEMAIQSLPPRIDHAEENNIEETDGYYGGKELEYMGIRVTSINQLMKMSGFPKPQLLIGKRRLWRRSEIWAWMDQSR